MQQELIRMVVDRTGLPEDKARMAAEAVITYLKGKLPAPVAGQLDSVVSAGSGSGLGGLASGLGGSLTGRE